METSEYLQNEAARLTEQAYRFNVPDHNIGSLVQYIINRIPTGDFLKAVLENNLMEACGRADTENMFCLENICKFIYNEAPSSCWGSPEKVKSWLAKRGEIHAGKS